MRPVYFWSKDWLSKDVLRLILLSKRVSKQGGKSSQQSNGKFGKIKAPEMSEMVYKCLQNGTWKYIKKPFATYSQRTFVTSKTELLRVVNCSLFNLWPV